MFKVTRTMWSISGRCNEYICTSPDDIAKLPRRNIPGTQESCDVDNEPCVYGSTALVCTGTTTEVYILNADNQWTKM